MSDPARAASPAAPLRVGIAGLGTVGAGLLALLHANAALIARRAGRPVTVTAISARDRARDRGTDISALRWHDDPLALATDPDVDVVVELIGGAADPALALVSAALSAGRPVVTANKALLALHGARLAALAHRHGAPLAYEAAVAGGIPVIKALREGLAGNRISSISGILNGTCNYILTTMREQGAPFAEVLAEAQRLGYAEADPSTDIDGHDSAHKLAILAALAFGRPVDFAAVHIEGIRAIDALDIAYASELGYRIKLLGIARRGPDDADMIEARVHPTMLPLDTPLATVDGVNNAVMAVGDQVGRVILQGRGAGAGPTASAVCADLIDLARNRATPVWGIDPDPEPPPAPASPITEHVGPYYLRLSVADRPGVIADITAALRDNGVSLEAMLQRGRSPAPAVPVVLVTHDTTETALRSAVAQINTLETVLEPPTIIRIEPA